MSTQDLGGTRQYVSGFTTKSYTINASNISGISGVQKATYGNTAITSVSDRICTINTPDLFSVVNGCGVYAIDGTIGPITTGSSIFMIPVVASIYNLNQFNMNDKCDAWLVFPGYSIQVFDTAGYGETDHVPSNILTNTYNKPVIFAANQSSFFPFSVKVFKNNLDGSDVNNDIYPTTVVSSIRVWFQNKEIFITGMSDSNAV